MKKHYIRKILKLLLSFDERKCELVYCPIKGMLGEVA